MTALPEKTVEIKVAALSSYDKSKDKDVDKLIPTKADTEEKKRKALYRMKEKLRLQYNEMGAKYLAGQIDSAAWDTFRTENRRKEKAMFQSLNKLRDQGSEHEEGSPEYEAEQAARAAEKEAGQADTSFDADIDLSII